MGSDELQDVICTEVFKVGEPGLSFSPSTKKLSLCAFAFRDDREHRNYRPVDALASDKLFPMLPQKELGDDGLRRLAKFFWEKHGGFASLLAVKHVECKALERYLHRDLAKVGGDIPPGYPNSQGEGMHRGNGLFAGDFASAVHTNKSVRNFAKIAVDIAR